MPVKSRTKRTPKAANRAASRKRSNRKPSRQPAYIADWRERVRVVLARKQENRANKKYDMLNADKWHELSGHVSNRVDDLDAYLGPAERAVRQIRTAMRKPGGRNDAAVWIETLSAHLANARQVLVALHAVRDDMCAELKWYEDELFKGVVRVDQPKPQRRKSTRTRRTARAAS